MATILVEILGNSKEFKHELDNAVKSTDKANSGFSKMGKVAGVAGLAVAGVLAVGLEKSVDAAMKAQEETGKLDKAIENAGLSVKKMTPYVADLEDHERKLGFTNNDTRTSLTKLITAGDDAAKANKDLATASDLARFKGESLAQATDQLIKVHAGNTRALKEVGIVLPPVTTAQDALKASTVDLTTETGKHELALAKVQDKLATGAQAAEILTGKVKGQADEFAKSSEGGMAVFHAQLGNIEEKIGTGLIPIITALVTGVNQAISWIVANWPRIEQSIAPVLDAIKRDIQILVDDGEALWQKFGGTIMKVLGDVEQVVKDDLKVIQDVFKIFGDVLSGNWGKLWTDVKQLFADAFSLLRDLVTTDLDVIKGLFAALWPAIKSGASAGLAALVTLIKGLPGDIVAALGDLSHLLVGAGEALVRGIVSGMGGLVGALIEAIKSAASSALSAVTSQFGSSGSGGNFTTPAHGRSGIGKNAVGGIATRATLGIFGEAGPEALIPLASSQGRSMLGGGGGGGTTINIYPQNIISTQQELVEMVRNELIRTGRRTAGGALGGFA